MATTSTQRTSSAGRPPERQAIPLLRNGDRLTAAEFERRYDAMPHLKKAELIEGVVYIPSPDFYPDEGSTDMASPVSFRRHGNPHSKLNGILTYYAAWTPGVEPGDNCSLRLDVGNMPQPDVFLVVLPEFGGQARISDDDFILGAPELVAEVAYSSVSYDLHAKLEAYRRNGVREYVVWRAEDRVIDYFALRDDRFTTLVTAPDGRLRSDVLPGLWLDPAALVRGDMAAAFRAAREGLDSPEHAAFVERLRGAGGAPPAAAQP